MNYRRIFNPSHARRTPWQPSSPARGDRRDGLVYVYTDEIVLSVNVALSTARPLLVRGPSGAGKSTLAQNVARGLNWRYYEEVISSHTQAQHLLWRFDALRRLNDAQAQQLQPGMTPYIEPGILWWAFDPQSAQEQAARAAGPSPADTTDNRPAVVLLDEIDKADPDLPNSLLVPLGSLQFDVPERDEPVKAHHAPLVFITTNDERELPTAFLRRCVLLQLPDPDKDPAYRPRYREHLLKVATAHFGSRRKTLYAAIADQLLAPGSAQERRPGQATPSPAEYLDTIRACLELNVRPGDETWAALSNIVLRKMRSPV